jgi:hypothetical protein
MEFEAWTALRWDETPLSYIPAHLLTIGETDLDIPVQGKYIAPYLLAQVAHEKYSYTLVQERHTSQYLPA